jgi:hypothetical protein
MVEETLVESQIAESITLVKALDANGDTPTFAAWYFFDDAEEWRLIIAGPTFDALLPKQEPIAYRKIVDAISSTSLSTLSLSHVKLVRTDDELLRGLRILYRTGPTTITRAHFANTTIYGIFVKDMYILRFA